MVLVQRGKGGMGIGNMGGGNQALFGGSGGQDVFQKITWICCLVLLVGPLSLSILKGKYNHFSSPRIPVHARQVAHDSSESNN